MRDPMPNAFVAGAVDLPETDATLVARRARVPEALMQPYRRGER